MPSGEVLGNTSRVPVVSQPPGLLDQAGGWVKERGMGGSLLGLGVVAATAFAISGHERSPENEFEFRWKSLPFTQFMNAPHRHLRQKQFGRSACSVL